MSLHTRIEFTNLQQKIGRNEVQRAIDAASIRLKITHIENSGHVLMVELPRHLTAAEKTSLATKFRAGQTLITDA